MKRIILVALLIFFIDSMLSAQTSSKIAVLDFQSNGTPQFIGNAVADIITTEFKNSNDIVILEKNQIQQILKEKNYQKNNNIDLNGIIESGQMLAVDRIIIGSVSKIGNSYTITGKIVEIKSGAIEYADFENCSNIDDIESAARYLAIKMLNRISHTYHELPQKNYNSKSSTDQVEVSLSARYGIIWGFRIPKISVPKQNSDEINIISREENVPIVEGILESDFYIYKGLSVKGLFKYSNSFPIEPYSEYWYYSTSKSNFRGFGLGTGLQYNFNYSKFVPFISADMILTRYWFEKTVEGNYGLLYGNVNWDKQEYNFKFAQYSNVLSTEISVGFKVLFTDNFGLKFGVGADIPLYGSQFDKFQIEKTYSYTDNDLIPLQQRDLETKLEFDQKDFLQPPMYFIQLGFIYII